jgi:hypothetical protein
MKVLPIEVSKGGCGGWFLSSIIDDKLEF